MIRLRQSLTGLLIAGSVSLSGCGLWRGDADNIAIPSQEIPDKLRDPARLSLSYAQLVEQSGRLPEAETHYHKVLELNPASIEAAVGLARVQLAQGRTDEAERAFQKVLKEHPGTASALHGLGRLQASREQWDDAAASLNQAVLAAPEDKTIRYELAVALVQAGDVDAALPHFIRTVGDAEAHYNVGLILHGRGDLPASEQRFRLAIAKKPDLAPAREWLETVLQEQHAAHGAVQTAGHQASANDARATHADYTAPHVTAGHAINVAQTP
jgi:Flp pilus assembly protein TadD